jgi:hypothetical protein
MSDLGFEIEEAINEWLNSNPDTYLDVDANRAELTKAILARIQNKVRTIELDGLEVSLYRGDDNKLVVDLETGGLEDKDVHPGGGDIPNIRIRINEQGIELDSEGNLFDVDDKPQTLLKQIQNRFDDDIVTFEQ